MVIENKITENEFRDRLKKVQQLMAKKKLDVLLEWAVSEPTVGGNVEYLSGVYSINPGLLVIPKEGDPVLCVAPSWAQGAITWINRVSWIQDVRGTMVEWGAPYAKDAKKAIKRLNLLNGCIGLSGVEQMKQPLYESFISEFPNIEILPRKEKNRIVGIVEQVRAIKSKAEIELIKEANKYSELGITTFFKAIKPGAMQCEAISIAEHEVMRRGTLGVSIPHESGPPFIWGSGHSYKGLYRWEEGQVVGAEFNARIPDGYWGQICRTYSIGDKPTDTQKRLYECVYDSQDRIMRSLKPGVTGEELTQIGIEALTEAGWGWDGLRYFHGMGLNMAEGVDGVLGEKTIIEAGNYLMIHTHYGLKETGDVAVIGDPVLVTEKGPLRLTTLNPPSPKLLPLAFL